MGAGLRVEGVRKKFGGLWAVDGVTLEVADGSIVGLIGPNGSGKTTLINLMNGVHKPDDGEVRIGETTLSGRPPHFAASHGVMRTFQNARVFSTITVTENMLVPTLHAQGGSGKRTRKARELLAFVGLEAKQGMAASELSGGQQKLLEFARALMTDPKVVLMDEPFAGVHPSIKQTLLERIRERNTQGTSFVIVSHEIPDLLKLSDHVICMDQGEAIASGEPQAVSRDQRVITAYLGSSADPEAGAL